MTEKPIIAYLYNGETDDYRARSFSESDLKERRDKDPSLLTTQELLVLDYTDKRDAGDFKYYGSAFFTLHYYGDLNAFIRKQ
jgi:hypothetical protein